MKPARIAAFVLVSEACAKSASGNWIVYRDEIQRGMTWINADDATLEEIAARMRELPQVADVEVTEDGIDVNLYTKYLTNYEGDV